MSISLSTTPCHCTSANASDSIKIRRNDPYNTTPTNAFLSMSASRTNYPKLDESDDTINQKSPAQMSSLDSNASFPSEQGGQSGSGGDSPAASQVSPTSQNDSTADCALLEGLACSRRTPVASRSAKVSRTPSIVTPQTPSETDSQRLAGPPTGTIHSLLWDTVTFVPYPSDEFVTPSDAIPAIPEMNGDTSPTLVRAFFGQLPYFVTNMQLSWLLYTFGGKHTVMSPERIIKKNPTTGVKLPTGCVHAYCTRLAIAEITALMHKKLLVDDTGIWVGQTPEEAEALAQYVEMHRRDKSMRVPNRAYDTMVVQLATSTFIPRRVMQMAALQRAEHCTAAQETPDVGPRFQSREEAEVHCQQRSASATPPTPLDVSSPQTHYPTNPSPNSRSSNFSSTMSSPRRQHHTGSPSYAQQPLYSTQQYPQQYSQYSLESSQMMQQYPQQQTQMPSTGAYAHQQDWGYQQQQQAAYQQPPVSPTYLSSPPEYGVANSRSGDLPW